MSFGQIVAPSYLSINTNKRKHLWVWINVGYIWRKTDKNNYKCQDYIAFLNGSNCLTANSRSVRLVVILNITRLISEVQDS